MLPETAAQLVELERLQQALAESEERAKNHWEQYLRAVADAGQRAQARASATSRPRIATAREARAGAAAGEGQPGAGRARTPDRADAASLVAGQEATLQLLAKAFEKLDIARSIRWASPSIRPATRR